MIDSFSSFFLRFTASWSLRLGAEGPMAFSGCEVNTAWEGTFDHSLLFSLSFVPSKRIPLRGFGFGQQRWVWAFHTRPMPIFYRANGGRLSDLLFFFFFFFLLFPG
jgi:hypothetical protein